MSKSPATLLCDFYKVSHKNAYPEGTTKIYSTLTPRSNKYFPQADGAVVFGIQSFIKKYLIEYFNEHFFDRHEDDVVAEYKRFIKHTLGIEEPDCDHIIRLHTLGYLPISIKALPEGTVAPIRVPILTIENTHEDFHWLTNYLETLLSAETWQPITSATIAREYRKLLNKYATVTTGSTDGVEFQAHDFSMRGMSSLDSAEASGAGHLLSFVGTDTIPAIAYLEQYYNANIEKELVGTSIPATEHSVMCAGTPADDSRDEYETFKRIITEVFPKGFVSIVSDTYDFWKVVGETLPRLKETIMSRDGKVVIRPDSGDPVEILCGKDLPVFSSVQEAFADYELGFSHDARLMIVDSEYRTSYKEDYEVRIEDEVVTLHFKAYESENDIDEYREHSSRPLTIEDKGLIEALHDIFGGTLTEQGYFLLDSHIGAIYGDSITLERAEAICERLKAKGYASTNVVFGVGSYTYQYNTRDSLGMAIKATYAEINGEEHMLFKDPKTDDGVKRSQRGRVIVENTPQGIGYKDNLNKLSAEALDIYNLLQDVFIDGELLVDESLATIRERVAKTSGYKALTKSM